jgi:hypothetical protein
MFAALRGSGGFSSAIAPLGGFSFFATHHTHEEQ